MNGSLRVKLCILQIACWKFHCCQKNPPSLPKRLIWLLFFSSFCSSLAIKEFSLNCTTFEFLRIKIKYFQFCFKNFLQLSLSLVDKSCSFRTFIGRYFYSLTSLSVSHLNLYTLSSKLFAAESPLKTMENAFLLHLKSTFCYQGI